MKISEKIKNTIKLFISLSVFSHDRIKAGICRIFSVSLKSRLIVLYYHSVKDSEKSRFSRQMKLLSRKTNIVGDEKSLPDNKKRVYSIVTFDDAFLCLKYNAVPVMNALNIRPIVFVPTKWIGTKPGWLENVDHADSDESVMSVDEISDLKDKVYFASHCHSHSSLKTLSIIKASEEINNSKRILEDLLGHSIEAISFPHGEYSEQNYLAAKKAGYKYLFSIDPEFINYDKFSKKDVIGRIKVNPSDPLFVFYLKIHGAYRWMKTAGKIKSRLLVKNK